MTGALGWVPHALVATAEPAIAFPEEPPIHAPGEPHPCDGCMGCCSCPTSDGCAECVGHTTVLCQTTPALLHSGEYVTSAVDLRVGGRGLDFVWARKYRSRYGHDQSLGHGWDHSYNIFVVQKRDGTLLLSDGVNLPPGFSSRAPLRAACGTRLLALRLDMGGGVVYVGDFLVPVPE